MDNFLEKYSYDPFFFRMNEVQTFLETEKTASTDPATLEAQLKESSSLQDDVKTLQPTVDAINELGIK